MNNDGKFTRAKKIFALLTGVLIGIISLQNSTNGFVSGSASQLLKAMGWSFSAACMAAQFMFASEFKKTNWTIIFLGGFAYLYSIPTNYIGLQTWNGVATDHNFVNAIAAIFMDVYPEAAIAWALGESKMGDMFGNLVRTVQRKDELTDTGPRPVQPRQPSYNNQPTYPVTRPQQPAQRPAPRPVPAKPIINPNEPTYHPVSYQPRDLADFLNQDEK